jgi:ubiquinone/menaquinone biosynthesis C-methylase UbiE
MSEPNYEYRGLMASTWDFLRGDTSKWEDKPFYRTLIDQYGQPVLDVGCGTGRLLLDYMADGLDVDGVDNSPEMLVICHEKAQERGLAPRLYEQWMEMLDLPRQYRTIIVPSLSFQLVTDSDKALQAMNRFFKQLKDGAALILPFMSDDTPSASNDKSEWGDWACLAEKTRVEDGAIIRRWIRGASVDQLQHTENRYEVEIDGKIVTSETIRQSPALRWYSQDQAQQICETAGFNVVQMYDGFAFNPAIDTSKVFTIVAEKFASN